MYIHTHMHIRFLFREGEERKDEGENKGVGIQGTVNSKEVLQEFLIRQKTNMPFFTAERSLFSFLGAIILFLNRSTVKL